MFDVRSEATPLNLSMRMWLEQHVDGLPIECSTGSIVVQMANPSGTFILESYAWSYLQAGRWHVVDG